MKTQRSSILLVSDDDHLRQRVKDVLEAEIDVEVEERQQRDDLSELDGIEIAAAIIDAGLEWSASEELFESLPAKLPLLTLHSGEVPEWLLAIRPEGETLERDAPLDHIVHALRLSLLRTMNLANRRNDSDTPPRSSSTEDATRSVLGDLRNEFRLDLAAILREAEELVRTHRDSARSDRQIKSDRVLPDSGDSRGTDASVDGPVAPVERPLDLFIDDVRQIRKLADTLDLAEYAPLLFALEITLRDLATDDGRSRVRDILRQLRNISAGRPASAGFDGRRIRVALIGANAQECHDFGLEDPDRLDVRPFKSIRTFARQIDLFRPDVVALRIDGTLGPEALDSLREVRGGTGEAVIALTEAEVDIDPIDALRFPLFAHFQAPLDWNEVATRVFQFKGDSARPARIIVVHDDPDAIAQVENCLDPESFFIESIASAAELLDKILDIGPDVVFIGDELQRVSGFDVCREIRAELPLARIPLVVLTNEADAATREQAFRVGADDCLELPLIGEEVRRRANLLIEHRKLRYSSTARDPLTGLNDACTLTDRLRDVLAQASAEGAWTSLLALDIDRFEMIRSFYGQASANTIVRSVADALRKIFELEDTIFRGTDDAFFVIRRAPLDDDASRERIFEGIADIGRLTFRSADGRGFYATVTGGHVLIPPGHLDIEDCVRRTLRVLAAARKTARGRIMTAEIDPNFSEASLRDDS